MIDIPAPHGTLRRFATSRCIALALCLLAGVTASAYARNAPQSLPDVALLTLPKEAQEAYALIGKGGPFRYQRDGITFGNREKLLPSKPRSYYREYTVPTPGANNRGAQRVICGGAKAAPDACYYTDDHYQSFRRIRE